MHAQGVEGMGNGKRCVLLSCSQPKEISLSERRATNIGLLCPKVCNNIGGGGIPIDVPPTKILEGMYPRHTRRG